MFNLNPQSEDSSLLSVPMAVLAFISTLIGGGILGIPFVFYQFGFIGGVIIMALFGILQCNALWILCLAKDILPGKPESLFEIGYLLFKRKSIFMISVVLIICSMGSVMVYLIVMSQISASLIKDMFGIGPSTEGFAHLFTLKQTWVIIYSAIMTPFCLRKDMEELQIVSIILFFTLDVFILILFLQLCIFGRSEFITGPVTSISTLMLPNPDINIYKAVQSISIIMVAFTITQNLYPVYSGLRVKTNSNFLKVVK